MDRRKRNLDHWRPKPVAGFDAFGWSMFTLGFIFGVGLAYWFCVLTS